MVITGPEVVTLEEGHSYTCVSGVSQPAADVHWTVTNAEGNEVR